MEIIQRAFQIKQKDNVATALEELVPGTLKLLSGGCMREAGTIQKIPEGHKIALQNVRTGGDVMRYGVRIARAPKDIRAGRWVHPYSIHNMYGERSSHLDVMTEAPKDTRYEWEASDE